MMELENLRDSWRTASDAALSEQTAENLKKITARVAAGKIQSSTERLRRRWRLTIIPIALLPAIWITPMQSGDPQLRPLCWGVLCLFITSALSHLVYFLWLLDRCDPLEHSVRAAAEAVVRLRRIFLRSEVIHILLAVVLLAIVYRQQQTIPFHEAWVYGFWTGIALGLPIGIRLFLRILSDIDVLAKAVKDLDE